MQTVKPVKIPPVDSSGHLLEIGDRVAYNFSGDVAIGRILSIEVQVKMDWETIRDCKIKIDNECPKPGHISTVKSYRNLIYIGEKQ